MRIFTEEDTALVIDLGAGVDIHGLKYWETKFDAFLAAYTGNKVISAKMLDNKWEEVSTRAFLLISLETNSYSCAGILIEMIETLGGFRLS